MSEAFFVNGRGIDLEAWRRRIRRHLGSDFVIEPSTYNGIDGYVLSATRPQTVEYLKDLVRRSGAISAESHREKSSVVTTTELVHDDDSIDENGKEDHQDASRSPSGIRTSLSRYFLSSQYKFGRLWRCLAPRRCMSFRCFVGPDRQTTPRNDTVVWNLIVLVLFFSSLCLAARYPTQPVRIAFVSISGLVFVALLASAGIDLVNGGDRRYVRNLGNTTLTVLLAIPLMTAMYFFMWYPELNRRVLAVSQDVVTEVRFPAVTLLQRLDWSSQAHILPVNYTKCFIGWLEAKGTTPVCKDLPPTALVPGQACNCSEAWSAPVVENFVWNNIAYRYLSFTPSAALISGMPTYIMTLQVFFNYNATFSLATSSQEQGPSLHMVIYDPNLSMIDALARGYSRMVLINANGDSSINLGLQYRQKMGQIPAYDYSLGISTIPNLNLVCNTALKGSYPCHITLFLQLPTFDRTLLIEESALSWLDVAASVGGYFSFVQALSWLLSGQAGAT